MLLRVAFLNMLGERVKKYLFFPKKARDKCFARMNSYLLVCAIRLCENFVKKPAGRMETLHATKTHGV